MSLECEDVDVDVDVDELECMSRYSSFHISHQSSIPIKGTLFSGESREQLCCHLFVSTFLAIFPPIPSRSNFPPRVSFPPFLRFWHPKPTHSSESSPVQVGATRCVLFSAFPQFTPESKHSRGTKGKGMRTPRFPTPRFPRKMQYNPYSVDSIPTLKQRRYPHIRISIWR